MKCPSCQQELTHVGRFWVCPEHGPADPLRPIQASDDAATSECYQRLREIAQNMWWSWQPEVTSVFRQIDPLRWTDLGQNPLRLLEEYPPERLEPRLRNEALAPWITWSHRRLEEYLQSTETWGLIRAGTLGRRPVAFFSLEFGIHESLPIYSGGLVLQR